MERFWKDNIAYVILAVIAFFGALYCIYQYGIMPAFDAMSQATQKKSLKAENEIKLDKLKQQALKKPVKKKENTNGKVIYEVLGQQFSPEASFGIMFENVINNITTSGVKIRSIDYNYEVADDKIIMSKTPGYNACELSFTTVSTYSQLQTFFKNIAKENYLTNLYEIYVEPYDKDKTILIAKFKLRLYTKTI